MSVNLKNGVERIERAGLEQATKKASIKVARVVWGEISEFVWGCMTIVFQKEIKS